MHWRYPAELCSLPSTSIKHSLSDKFGGMGYRWGHAGTEGGLSYYHTGRAQRSILCLLGIILPFRKEGHLAVHRETDQLAMCGPAHAPQSQLLPRARSSDCHNRGRSAPPLSTFCVLGVYVVPLCLVTNQT